MHYRAVDVEMKEGTTLEVTFHDGMVKGYDMSVLFEKLQKIFSSFFIFNILGENIIIFCKI